MIFKIFKILTPNQREKCKYIIGIIIIGAFFEAIGIGTIMPLISIMGNENFFNEHQIIEKYVNLIGITKHYNFVIACSIGLIIIYILKNLYMVWQNKIQIDFILKNQIEYSRELMANYLQKPYTYHLNHNTATILRNINSSGIIIFSNILIPIFYLLTEIITVIMIWLMLIYIDAFTAIVVAGFLGILLYSIIIIFRRKIAKQGKIQNKYSAQYIKWVNQGLGSIKETKVLHKEKFFLESFGESYKKYGEANKTFLFLNQLPKMMIEAIVVSGLFLLIVIKLLLGDSPQNIVPLLGVLALAAFRLMPSANRIVAYTNTIKFNMPLFEELYDELITIRNRKMNKESVFLDNRQKILSFEECIEIKNLQYKYPEGENLVLKNVSFSIPKGKFVGIIGSSGAGKTTFVDILLGLLMPTSGCITVDDKDISENLYGWQENLSYVPQSVYLIDGTIRENIALGIAENLIDDKLVEKVLKMTELYEFTQALPEGIETNIGERGVKLSGGQRQRIGIARALYCQPNVLILDEATSALDNETEKNITKTILKLKGQITIIAIAHRISTLEDCDFKVKFIDGQVEIIDNKA